MKQVEYSKKVLRESFIIGCSSPSESNQDLLCLNFSDWLNVFDQSALIGEIEKYKCVSLTLRNVNRIEPLISKTITEIVGPKLTELTFDNCNELTWNKDIKKLLTESKGIQVLKLVKNKWLEDSVLEQLSIRYQSSLMELEIEHSSNITNNGLFQIGRRCTELKIFRMICCNKITDAGLFELNKKIKLNSLHIHHSMQVTDNTIEALVSMAEKMTTVSFVNCPKLTDRSMAAFFEAKAAWGKRRNLDAATITSFEIRDNGNITYETMNFLSTGLLSVAHLDFRDCSALNLVKGLNQMVNLQCITSLKLGPCKIDSAAFAECMLNFMGRLTVLHLNGMKGLIDEHLSNMLDEALELEELHLEDISFGTLSCESIMSNIPNIARLTLIKSPIILDPDLKAVITICLHLRELTVQRCPKISDAAFIRCVNLKYLERVDIANCSAQCTGAIVKFFTVCPLLSLCIDGLSDCRPASCFPSLNFTTYYSLRTISLRGCSGVTAEDVYTILQRFVCCTVLDLTDVVGVAPQQLKAMWHPNPFLTYTVEKDFSGYRMTDGDRAAFVQYYGKLRQYRRHHGARCMQALRRKYLKRLLELKQVRRDNWSAFKIERAIKIQAQMRRFLVRKKFVPKIIGGRRMVLAVRTFIVKFRYAKAHKAWKHYRRHLKAYLFKLLCQIRTISQTALKVACEGTYAVTNRYLVKKTFQDMVQFKLDMVEKHFVDSALVVWEIAFLKSVMNRWRTVINETTRHRMKLLKIFMNVVDAKTHNSFRQQAKVKTADMFRHRRLVIPAWLCFAHDLLEIRRVASLEPMAIEYFKKSFFNRVVGSVYYELLCHRNNRKFKKAAKIRGERWYIYYKCLLGCRQLDIRMRYRIRERNQIELMKPQRLRYMMKLAFRHRFRVFTRHSIYFKLQKAMVDHYLRKRRIRVGYHDYFLGVVRMKKWRVMNKKAEMKRDRRYVSRTFKAWVQFKHYKKDLGALYFKQYQIKQMRKVLKGFNLNLQMAKDYVAAMAAQAAARAGSEKAFKKAVHHLRSFQAIVRGKLQRAKFKEERIQKLYAVQTIQSFTRVALARKQFASKIKKKDLAEKVREDLELDAMREAEAETMYYNYQIKAIIKIQSAFRGWVGRGIAFQEAILYFRRWNIDFRIDNEHVKAQFEVFKRAAIAREHQRAEAAVMIQKHIRGIAARKIFKILQWKAKMAVSAVCVQREYRRRLAQLKLRRMKRDKLSDMRFRAARKQRGMLLRMFGLKDRIIQRKFKPMLDNLGLDPITFNYRVGELVSETISDFWNLVDIYDREKALVKEHGLKRNVRAIERRKIVAEQGWKMKIQDAVRIIEPGHKYEGYTGTIVRIDDTVLGIPLYEIKLDRFPLKQSFVRMTGDPLLNYTEPQPLSKVRTIVSIPDLPHDHEIYGLNPEDPFFSQKNIDAAWKIQCFYRCHRSRMIVARKRYEFWMRCCATQWSLFNHMSETNTLSMQGYHVAQALKISSAKPVFFDEIRHFILPSRLVNVAKKSKEEVVIGKEFESKYRDRMTYLQKCALIQGKQFFAVGFERMTFTRKLRLFTGMAFGLFGKGGTKIKDVQGSKGVKFLSKQQSMVTGLDKYCFKQFQGSPHVRYYKTSLYQGEWSGVPLFTPLKPHGEGLISFLDGWGFAREDKVLYLTIIRCQYLNPMDLTSSDPYCDISCNGFNLQTTVKWKNLNPEYHESFEIDVTNPNAMLIIVVKDKDFLGSDDFMGQVQVPMSDFIDGKEHQRKYNLRGEEYHVDEGGYDRGEIEFRCRWAQRVFEDDQIKNAEKQLKAIRIQAWARRIAALSQLRKFRKERQDFMLMVRNRAVKITSICRMRLARKEFKKRFRFSRSALKIQKRVRIWIAKKVFAQKKLRSKKATIIQARMRVVLAKNIVIRMKQKMAADLDAIVTLVQKNARRLIVRARVWRVKQDKLALAALQKSHKDDDDDSVHLPDAPRPEKDYSWIKTYGRDPEYGLKRNRRITKRLFDKMLTMRFVRLQSRFGTVYVDSYPPKLTESEILSNIQGSTSESLTVRTDFVGVYFPPFRPISFQRPAAIELCKKYEHIAILHLESSIYLRKSVDYTVTIIQCAQRCRVARKARVKMLRVLKAIAIFQRIFRRRYEILHKCSIIISSLFRLIGAKLKVRFRRKERKAAWTIQASYRCYRARCAMFDLRCVEKLSVLRATPSVEHHGPEKCLEHRDDTFWLAESNEKAEIRIEFGKVETVTEIWIMTSTFQTSPQNVFIEIVPVKATNYVELIEQTYLPMLKQHRWHKFRIPVTATKYFKFTFNENYGDDKYIGVRQIRFLRSREKSAKILKEPNHYVLDNGPMIGHTAEIILKVEADGWPVPTYQWYKKNKKIKGATTPELKLSLHCAAYGQRTYRCIRCKMISKEVPLNAYHIKCGNCAYLFNYKDIDEYDQVISKLKEKEVGLHRDKNSLMLSKIQMEQFNNPNYKSLLQDVNDQLRIIEYQLQKLREERITLKDNMETVNRFSDEGIYTCHIQNLRGGSFKIKRQTISAVVVVEHSKPYLVAVVPTYTPRPQTIRKKWNIYSSIMGTFKKGKVEGLVVIRYYDGSYYEGPYVQEDAIDSMGVVEPSMRAYNHFGVYKMADGRIFEGVNVDNHFDPHNLQSFYRLRLPDGELYEGNFCDEFYHGIGMYTYKDGSVYEGSWHRGTRFGHGHYRSAEGWAYEGFYDTNRRHREGIITWPDGSCYMGDWYYDKIQGKGIFVTALKDIYRGELVDGQFHGAGEMIYGDGSRYVGHFAEGLRHGRGIFSEKEGNEYYGHFVKDLYHGEVLVKLIIPIEEKGQDNFEIRIAVYEHGNFIKWKSKFSNPLATKQFVALFKDNRDMFDSVYSMILAKNLPALPDGIDAGDPQVKQIVFKIRNEAGMLVGQHALNQAQAQLDALLKPLKEKTDEVDQLKQDIENMSMKQLVLEKDAAQYNYKFTNIIVKYEKETQKIEQYWTDDPREVRGVFQQACEALDTVSVEEFFAFRNHRVVPLYVKKIFDAISVLLKIPLEWKIQQYIIADSVANSRNGDEEAVRFDYKCKLYHIMKGYKVYDYVSVVDSEELAIILADCRFRSDSYYIESLGKPGPILVDWVKTNYAYVKAAMTQYKLLNAAEESKIEAFRFKAIYTKKNEEIQELITKLDEAKNKLKKLQLELEDLQHMVLKANDLLQFITGRTQVTHSGAKADYYKLLEQKLEANRDKFVIEVCIQSIVDGVVENMEKDKKAKIRECLAMGTEYVEPDMSKVYIVDWMRSEILDQQDRILGLGKTLGYSFEPEATDVTKAYTEQIISLVIDICIAKMNDKYNDMADARQWVSMKGRVITSRFLYIQAWKIWEKEAIIKRDIHACKAWEEIWVTPEQCAKMAIEARISTRMSKVAREQAKVWAKGHADEIAAAEVLLSYQFQELYPEDTARAALALQEDTSDSISPADRAMCMSWVRLHPVEMNAARDEMTLYYSEEFAKQFPSSTGETAFKILNGWGSSEEMLWIEYADYWKSWNMEKYNASSDMFMQDQAKDFVDAFPLNTIVEAARVLENAVLHKYVMDEETLAACTPDPKHILAANCWGLKNQGLLRKGRELLRAENMNNIGKQWNELLLNTENFQKGHIMLAVSKTLPNGDVVVEDRFVGYRARLMSKFAWMYAYFCKQREDLIKDIADHNMNDPIDKVFHNIRPSEREKVLKEIEDNFLNTRKKLEDTLAQVIEKITSWNTYFGLQESIS